MPQTASPSHIVGAKIKQAAAAKRISQTTLGAAANLPQSAISRRLSGAIAFTIDELDALAQLLEIPLAELVSAEAP